MKTTLWVVLAMLTLQANAQNIVSNGSFETFGATLTGWNTVEGYGWEAVTSSAADGQTFAIINGDIFQDLSTTPGQTYLLRYAVSGTGSSGIVTLQTYWGGNLVASTPFDTTGLTNGDLGWIYVTNILLGTTSTTRLWFANANGLNAPAPNLDDVSAVAFDAAPTSCIGVPDGIVGWWKGQSNALDSVDANHGILLNGTGFTNGLVGQAFFFAGGNQCVQMPYSATLAASNYSIETWVQPLGQITDPSTQSVLFAQNNGQCQLLALAGTSGLRLALQFAVDPSTAVDVESVSEIPIGQFTHVAGTWDGSTLRLYVNGALDAESKPGAIPFDSGCAFYIGGIYNTDSGSCSNVTGFFDGLIDEVSYYRRALSDGEIGFIFRVGNLGKCGVVHPPVITLQPIGKTVYAGSTVTFTANAAGDLPLGLQWQFNGTNLSGQTTTTLTLANVQLTRSGNYALAANNAAGFALSSNVLLTVLPAPPCVTVTNGLVSWWQAETNLLDGWDSNDGSLLPRSPQSGPGGLPFLPVAFAPGKVGQAFSINTNGVLVADNISLRVTNALSIEGWINPTTVSGSTLRTIFAKFAPPVGLVTNSSYYLGTSNGFLVLKVSSTGLNAFSLIAPQPLQAGQWSHVAATYDGSMLRLYINGVTVAQTSYSAGIFAGNSDAGIGAVPFQQSAWYLPWSGYLDEISLYNRALSDSEILDIFNADLTGKCLVPPLIAVQPQNLAVPLNEDAIFSSGVLGSKPLRYQWRFNGTNVLNATASRLALEHVQSNNVGNYSFIVTNTLGRATSSVATLTLLPPLSCVSAPTGMIAWWPANNFLNDVIGTNFMTLSSGPFGGIAGYTTGKVGQCFILSNAVGSAANSPELNIRSNADFSVELWYKGSPTNAIGGFQTTSSGTDILRKLSTSFLPPTTSSGYSLLLDDSGHLTCQLAKLPNGSTNVPTFTAPGSDIRDGLFHHLAFTLHRNTPDGGRLYVDGQLLLAFSTTFLGSFSLSNSTSLVIGETSTLFRQGAPAQRIDELTFYNRALSPTEILSIYQAGSAGKCIPPPTIPIGPTNQLVQAGGTATFAALASGFPPLRYQWRKNGTNVPGSTIGGTALPYTIVNVTPADAGQYSVAVSNIGGVTTSAVATLTVNRSPIAGNFNAATVQNTPISIPIGKLLLSASDPDADPLSLSSVATPTTNGGSFISGTTDITYTPSNGYIGLDSSTYTVSDGRGGSASALINIQIRSANQLSGNLLPLTPIAGGFQVTFAGIPGYSYTLQRAESVNGPWSNITAVIVGSLGIGIYDDTNSPPPTAFYRTVYP